ncbi:hypothetical protein ACJJIF_02540 [Microbulbifer sp. SSSA002]|uniref:hypothetical protein n=1 Tax=unclassified Microbulbifer TaxID=2619833 RepID=UPI00403920C1
MSNSKPLGDSYLPPDFQEQLDKLVESQGTDAELGKALQKSILDTCREINDALSKSFSDISSTGFEPSGDGEEQGEENE